MVDIKFVPIIPHVKHKAGFNTDRFNQGAVAQIAKTIGEAEKLFRSTTRTFTHPVDFKTKLATLGNLEGSVSTDDKNYIRIVRGTPGHFISAKNKPYLAFRRGSWDKTRVGVIGSYPGRKFGRWVRVKRVYNKGIRPRMFDEAIAKRVGPGFVKGMDRAIKRGARR